MDEAEQKHVAKEAHVKKRKGRKRKKRYLRLRLIKQNGISDWCILLMLRLQRKKGGIQDKVKRKKKGRGQQG